MEYLIWLVEEMIEFVLLLFYNVVILWAFLSAVLCYRLINIYLYDKKFVSSAVCVICFLFSKWWEGVQD